MAYPGKIIAFEGPDDVGKTTLAGRLREVLERRRVPCELFSFPGQDEGTLGRLVYDLHHASSSPPPDPAALQVAHVAAHIDLLERQILPALEEGACVILDRYWWSTWVYGVVAGAKPWALKAILGLERRYWRGVRKPTIILLRREQPFSSQQTHSKRLRAEYDALAEEEEKRKRCSISIVDNDRPIDETVATIVQLTERVWRPLAHRERRLRKSRVAQLTLPFDPPTALSDSGPTMVIIAAQLTAAKPTEVYDTYWRFAAERQAVFFHRLVGHPPSSWTKDEIIREHRFTNAYRASDRVSQYLIRHVIRAGNEGPDDLLFRILLFKMFNKIETWRLLEAAVETIRWTEFSVERYAAVLDKAFARGVRIYSAAYIMPSGGRGSDAGRKHLMHLRLIERMIRDGLAVRLGEAKSMEAAFGLLRAFPSIGDFLAYQLLTDINYSDLTPFEESDYVMPGPGARDGLRKCFSDFGGLSEPNLIKLMVDRQELEFDRLGLKFQSLWGRRLQLIDCQNLFCEVDKYARVKHPDVAGLSGRTKIKQHYRIDPTPIDPMYPRKYKLDDVIRQWRAHVSAV